MMFLLISVATSREERSRETARIVCELSMQEVCRSKRHELGLNSFLTESDPIPPCCAAFLFRFATIPRSHAQGTNTDQRSLVLRFI